MSKRPEYFRCPDCGDWHRRMDGGNQILPCAATVRQRSIDRIDRSLARAFGHGACDPILKRAAQEINTWAECTSWGPDLQKHYLANDHILSRYIKADLEKFDLLRATLTTSNRPGLGHNSRLTAEEADLVVSHWNLVDSEAHKIARKDTELHDRLTAVGRAELEKAVRRFDITRDVTFGAFVKERIRGCMLNHLDRVWNPEPDTQVWGDDRHKRWFEGMTRSERLSRRVKKWLAPYRAPESRLIPGRRSQGMTEAALAKLNPRQQAVYRGRVLTKPPLSRADLARQLGITDVTQISRIEKQARRKMRGPKES